MLCAQSKCNSNSAKKKPIFLGLPLDEKHLCTACHWVYAKIILYANATPKCCLAWLKSASGWYWDHLVWGKQSSWRDWGPLPVTMYIYDERSRKKGAEKLVMMASSPPELPNATSYMSISPEVKEHAHQDPNSLKENGGSTAFYKWSSI